MCETASKGKENPHFRRPLRPAQSVQNAVMTEGPRVDQSMQTLAVRWQRPVEVFSVVWPCDFSKFRHRLQRLWKAINEAAQERYDAGRSSLRCRPLRCTHALPNRRCDQTTAPIRVVSACQGDTTTALVSRGEVDHPAGVLLDTFQRRRLDARATRSRSATLEDRGLSGSSNIEKLASLLLEESKSSCCANLRACFLR